MRKTIIITLLVMLAGITTIAHATKKQVGGDISLLTKYETNGALYYDENGAAITDMLTFLKSQGLNAMRLRLFVDPSNATSEAKGQGVIQDLDYVKALGKRIKDAGFSLLLDFHYSDTWADPSHQWTPKAWQSLSDEQLLTQIYNYTQSSLQELVAAGATPDFIQIGNEVSYGMLWGISGTSANRCYTSSSDAVWARFTNLLKQAGSACRAVCPEAKIVIHSERVPKTNVLKDFFDRMKAASVDYDIIGLSYYPKYHGFLSQLDAALNLLEHNYTDKEIMIVETNYNYAWYPNDAEYDYTATYPATPDGQQAFTKALIEQLNSHEKVVGLYWWWLEGCENGLDWNTKRVTDDWNNASLFNDKEKVNGVDGITFDYPAGKVMPAIAELKNFITDDTGIDGLRTRQPVNDKAWYSIDGRKLAAQPTAKGVYINNGRKVVVE